MNNYRNINSVEELKTIYNINESIVVEKKGDGKADENVKQTTFLKDKLKVEYADLKEVSKYLEIHGDGPVLKTIKNGVKLPVLVCKNGRLKLS
jgi:hypothetical protein